MRYSGGRRLATVLAVAGAIAVPGGTPAPAAAAEAVCPAADTLLAALRADPLTDEAAGSPAVLENVSCALPWATAVVPAEGDYDASFALFHVDDATRQWKPLNVGSGGVCDESVPADLAAQLDGCQPNDPGDDLPDDDPVDGIEGPVSAQATASASTLAASSIGGPITRAEVLQRAQGWVDNQPGPYNQHAFSWDPTHTRKYRRDCSGLVGMSWHLNADPSTRTLHLYSNQISKSDLLPGDILNLPAAHTVIFKSWKSDHRHFTYYTFGSTPVKIRTAAIDAGTIDSHRATSYVARRYTKITGATPSPTPTKPTGKDAPTVAYDQGDGSMRMYRWLSDGDSFNRTSDYDSGAFHLSAVGDRMAAGDVNGDGKDDVVMAYQLADGTFSFYVWRNGNSAASVWYTSGRFSLAAVGGRLVLGDFNGDKKAEPALAYDQGDGTMRIYRWLSDGDSFNRTTDYDSGAFHLSAVGDRMAAGDVNGDGKDDIVMAYQQADGTFSYYVWRNGNSAASVWYTSGSYNLNRVAGRLVLGDFNGDKKAEPALAYDQGDGTMRTYRWLSDGDSFNRTTDYDSGAFHLSAVGDRMAAGDVDGDGRDDIVMAYQLAGGTFAYYVWRNGNYAARVWYTSGSFDLTNVAGRLVLGNW
ncbi:VCBS repeat-containing protein [Actinoplanes oblitus]|uniref:VCBS repeat-containing protein n=1 Tax=Actinoplanes oblitus TaxID=3040509 RepID=A0ABY8W6T1_9ACTN|nr:VCBS repeat-containing protein [Actinoplanes oblitus]WIM92733.1 VCBS repeat-containing protein [Actinoplanes oblitus]